MSINTNRWNRLRYTLLAPVYDLVTRFPRERAHSIGRLELQPGERVLIVGCGTGADLPYLPPGIDIVAGDITPAMIRRTRIRAATLGLAIRAEIMDGQDLPFPSGSFDAVVLHLIIAVIPDPRACLREVARVLAVGGRAAVFDKFAPDAGKPRLWRRVANLLTNLLATDITRQLGPLLEGVPLRIVERAPAMLGGLFEYVLLEREVESAEGS